VKERGNREDTLTQDQKNEVVQKGGHLYSFFWAREKEKYSFGMGRGEKESLRKKPGVTGKKTQSEKVFRRVKGFR